MVKVAPVPEPALVALMWLAAVLAWGGRMLGWYGRVRADGQPG